MQIDLPSYSESYNEREVLFVFAIIATGGKQYKVSEGDIIFIEKIDAEDGSNVVFDNVLAYSDGKKFSVDAKKVTVNATVLKNGKGKKIRVFRYKAKKNEKKCQGHRQPYTKVQINNIVTK